MLIQDFSFIIGDTQPVNVTVNINLSGSTIRWFLKNSVNDDDNTYVLTKSTSSGITVTNAASGIFNFTLSSVETAALLPITYYHEIKVTDSLGNVTTVLSGSVYGSNGSVNPSYASIEYADAYFDDVLFPEPWTTSDAATKTKALRMATKKIDALMLIGRRVNSDQAQEFPRSIYNSGSRCWVDESEIAQCVKDATCEEALALLRGGTEASKRAELQRQGVSSFSLGKLSESYSGASTGNRLQSPTAAQLLSRYTGGARAIG